MRKQDFRTKSQADDAENASNAGHSSRPQKLAIIESDVTRRTVYYQSGSIGCRGRGEGVMGGGGVDIDVSKWESCGGHSRAEWGLREPGQ